MKKHLKLGLVAFALLGAVSAFATSSTLNGWFNPSGTPMTDAEVASNCRVQQNPICAIHFTNGVQDATRYQKLP